MPEGSDDTPVHQTVAISSTEPAPTFAELERQHERLVQELAIFDRATSFSVVAGLLTVPGFHAHTVRLETLLSLIHRNARGGRRPTRETLARWINRHLGHGYPWRAEDPVEDVFISNAISRLGNSRIFEGIWDANDFWLQQVIDTLLQLDDTAEIRSLFSECLGILQMSEMVADRCGLCRFSMGGGIPREPLLLPSEDEVYRRAQTVCFSSSEIERAGSTRGLVQEFVHPTDGAEGSLGNSTLERRPLLLDGKNIIVGLPSAVSPAIRLHTVDRLERKGLLDDFELCLGVLQNTVLSTDALRRLEGDLCDVGDLPRLPSEIRRVTQYLCKFDRGKFAHIILCQDNLADLSASGLVGVQRFTADEEASLSNHLRTCAKIIAARADYSGGLTILVVGGLGRSFAFSISTHQSHWYPAIYRLSDFVVLGKVQGTTFLRLWKLKQQLSRIQSRGLEVENINGDLNLLGFWWQHGFRLVPREVPVATNNLLVVDLDYIAEVRRKLRTAHESHAIFRRRPMEWVPVHRFHTGSLFKEGENLPIYVDVASVSFGHLRAAAETSNRAWWLSTLDRATTDWHRELQYRVWDAVLNWLLKTAAIAEGRFSSLPRGPIEIFLQFTELDEWTLPSVDRLPATHSELETAINVAHAQIRIAIPVGFFRRFAEPRNVGERALVRAILIGAGSLCHDRPPSTELDELVQSVVRSDDARFFHLAFAHNYRQQVAGVHGGRPRFLSKEDSHFNLLELSSGKPGGAPTSGIVHGRKSCNEFLHGVVDECWGRIRDSLLTLDRKSVILRCLESVEAIELDKEQWRLTASALLASHEDKDDVLRAATKRESKRTLAQIANRTLVEMAVCTCPEKADAEINDAVFDCLCAWSDILLHSAVASDAQKYEFADATLNLFPNGEFETDQRYQREIITPYTSGTFGEEFREAANSYENYFQDPREQSAVDHEFSFDAKVGEGFEAAFASEYGITPEQLIKIVAAVENDGMKDDSLVIQKSRSSFEALLRTTGLEDEAISNVIRHFALWPRGSWDETPTGFTPKDWQPWRFRRRLSLIARPFVMLGGRTADELLYAPGFVFHSVGLLLDRCVNGELPSEYFYSPIMRSWIGAKNQALGAKFEEDVASKCKNTRLHARSSIQMTEFLADPVYGDLDTLAWDDRGTFLLIECKRLRAARTVAEIGEQLRAFRGEEKDRLAKHLSRCEWIQAHPRELNRVARTQVTSPNIVPLLVTNTIVPMQFVINLPLATDHVVPISRLPSFIEGLRSSNGLN
jgi:hypothetical protein